MAVDLATNEFDIEQIKNKEPSTILKACQKMFKRKYIESPKVTVTTDGGNELKSYNIPYIISLEVVLFI